MASSVKFTDECAQYLKYPSQNCGICELDSPSLEESIIWPNHISEYAHANCYKKIEPVESDLVKKLKKVFNDDNKAIYRAHIAALKAVKSEIGDPSIKEYLNIHGENALQSLFAVEGMKAAQRYAFETKNILSF